MVGFAFFNAAIIMWKLGQVVFIVLFNVIGQCDAIGFGGVQPSLEEDFRHQKQVEVFPLFAFTDSLDVFAEPSKQSRVLVTLAFGDTLFFPMDRYGACFAIPVQQKSESCLWYRVYFGEVSAWVREHDVALKQRMIGNGGGGKTVLKTSCGDGQETYGSMAILGSKGELLKGVVPVKHFGYGVWIGDDFAFKDEDGIWLYEHEQNQILKISDSDGSADFLWNPDLEGIVYLKEVADSDNTSIALGLIDIGNLEEKEVYSLGNAHMGSVDLQPMVDFALADYMGAQCYAFTVARLVDGKMKSFRQFVSFDGILLAELSLD